MRPRRKTADLALEALEAASEGFEILLATRRYQRVLAYQGLEGVRRIVRENRERELRVWVRAAKRARLVQARKIGDRYRIALTDAGRIRLAKLRVLRSRTLPGDEAVIVAFDFPVQQKAARDSFRNFLKTARFERVQQSVWRSRRDAVKPIREFVRYCGITSWVRVFRVMD